MAEFFRYIGSVARRLLGLQPAGFQSLMAQRGHFGTRSFHRHTISFPKAGSVEFGEKKLPLLNISREGVCIAAPSHLFVNLLQVGGRFRSRLRVMGISRHLMFSVAYLHGDQVGLRFEQLSGDDEQFLQLSLRFLDYGLILQTLSKQEILPAFHGPNWHSYGLEDHDVIVHLNINLQGVLEEINLTYRNGFHKEIICFNREAISVARSPRKKLSVFDKKRILRNALLVLMGLRQVGETDQFDRLINSGITRLFKKDSPKS